MRHGTYWSLKDKIFEDESCNIGCRDKASADRYAEQLSALGHIVTVRKLETIEHDRPADSPEFREESAFGSERWCVIVQTNEAAGEGG